MSFVVTVSTLIVFDKLFSCVENPPSQILFGIRASWLLLLTTASPDRKKLYERDRDMLKEGRLGPSPIHKPVKTYRIFISRANSPRMH
ncbi:hypothetical protein GDO81_009927 [Engystomops pustulosus]|uniref:Secreted protein n=1 Tax=Engystomops pustulosus TaxID=76066 RepID=A0AAV7BW90_ENGPU|nr:hypothetical protein GDO81_009927 [Engystomops pustulosus]